MMEPQWPYRSSKPCTNGSLSSIQGFTSQSTNSETSLPMEYILAGGTSDGPNISPSKYDRSRRDSRHKTRAQLFGNSDLSVRESSDEEREGKSGILEAARGVKSRLSRTGTIVTQLPNARRSRSLIGHPHAQASAASVGQELDNNQMIDQIKERAFHNQLAALSYTSLLVDEGPHTKSIASPIRRKSLLTPGIATRTPSDILRKPPQLEPPSTPEIQDYYFNPILSTSSPLSRLAGHGTDDNGRGSPVSRAATPSDLDYTHLGGLKLGTLRITNGSDTQSLLHRPRSPDFHCIQGQFTVSESRRSNEDDADSVWEAVRDPNKESIGWISIPDRSDKHNSKVSRTGKSCEKEVVGLGRSGSPLKQQHLQTALPFDDDSIGNRSATPSQRNEYLVSQTADRNGSQDHNFNLAEDEACKLASSLSPLSSNPPPVRSRYEGQTQHDHPLSFNCAFESPSKGASAQNHLNAFLNETEKRHSNGGSITCDFSTANTSRTSVSYYSSESRPASSSTISENIHQACDANDLKVSAISAKKHDSGYSSCTSVQISGQTTRPTLKSYIKRASCTSDTSDAPKDQHNTISLRRSNSSILTPPCLPVINTRESIIDNFTRDLPSQSSPDAKALASIRSSASPKSSSTLRKLRKPRPLSQHSLVNYSFLQDRQDLNQLDVPPIPIDIAQRHAERQNQFPLLEHTFPSLHHTRSSDGSSSPELVFVPIRFPSPENDLMEDPEQGIRNPHRSHWKNYASITRFKSQRRRSEPPQINGIDSIADLGTVTESLGGSPYDIARSTQSAGRHANSHIGISHPHQMTTATPRPKSTSGMNDAYATQLMHSRSQYRGEGTAGLGMASYNDANGRQERPRSLVSESTAIQASHLKSSQLLSNDRGFESFKPARPRSIFANLQKMPSTGLAEQPKTAASCRALFIRQDEDSCTVPGSEDMTTDLPLPLDINPIRQPESRVPSRKSFNDPDRHPGKKPRPRSMYADIPPVPVLPTTVQVELREAQIYRSNSAQPQAFSHASKKSISNQAHVVGTRPKIDEEVRKIAAEMPSREVQSQAWSKVQSIAKDEVLKPPRVLTPIADDFSTSQPPQKCEAVRLRSVGSYRPDQHLDVPRTFSKSPIASLAPPRSYSVSPNGSMTSLHSSGSAESNVQRLSGRYEGGLYFGYEAGFGLGGSAGTRNIKSGASRKSVEVSMAYGLDLSDLPIMVRPR